MGQRSRTMARKTYDSIVGRLTHLHPNDSQARQIDQRLALLKARLEAAHA